MLINIRKFTLVLVVILFSIFYSVFIHYYLTQQERTASAILKSINNNISELSYTLSKSIKSKAHVISARSLLDRVVSNNDLISAILIADYDDILLTTDPYFKSTKLPSSTINTETSDYDELMKRQFIESEIRFYVGNKVNYLKLIFVLDKDEISLYFMDTKIDFFIYFGIIPLFLFLLIFGFLFHFLSQNTTYLFCVMAECYM